MHPSHTHATRSVVLILALGAIATACGSTEDSSDPLVGKYQITSHTLSETGDCEMVSEVTDRSECIGCTIKKDFFKFKMQSLFGQSIPTIVSCDDANTCDDDDDDPDTISFGGPAFEKRVGDRWEGSAHAAGGSGTSCTYTRTDWVLSPTDDGATLTRKVRTSMLTVADFDECSAYTDNPPAEDTLTCRTDERIEATTVEP